ncbi:hypothetical protein MKW94_008237 [Papaver nudicaule]|uniref:F-box domain-containing protein n=1 Tax=Papaver nudicaule TaxID=74823 RepID=A0AA41VIP1_PAPNU|nr:hypothetical protein [Papaver nudicaule]
MMNLASNDKDVEAQGENATVDDNEDDSPCKISTTSSYIANLPDDCLNRIFKCLETKDDRKSIGLTCRQWLHIQNDNHESLWYRHPNDPDYILPKFSPEIFPKVLCKLLTRFQNLKCLSLRGHPEITDLVTLQSQFCRSIIQNLCLDLCLEYSDTELSLMFSWLPRLTLISLKFCHVTDEGLYALAECCSSLQTVNLSYCQSITDSGISFLLQNCHELDSLSIRSCSSVTGIGFLGCAQNLTHVDAGDCKLKPEGIEAIVSGGGIECLNVSPAYRNFAKVIGEGCINTEAVMTISKGCPLLKELNLANCKMVELEGWLAIGRNCKNLELLTVCGCKLCDLGLQALCNGCNKLCMLYVGYDNCCSSSALEFFKCERPYVIW